MSRKLTQIPEIPNYDYIRNEMNRDLAYRLKSRKDQTFLGRPLYYRINIQVITTQECPFNCPFCLERQNPMEGHNDFPAQIESLKRILKEHPLAKMTITGGEPGLYPEHVQNLIQTYAENSNQIGCSINTTGYSTELNDIARHSGFARIKLSCNDYVQGDPRLFPNCMLQTVVETPTLEFVKDFMANHEAKYFKFRFLSGLEKKDYDIQIWNELRTSSDFSVKLFRIGDFFVNASFTYEDKFGQVALGDMWQQKHNNYEDGYSNIIIHPDGRIGVNWS